MNVLYMFSKIFRYFCYYMERNVTYYNFGEKTNFVIFFGLKGKKGERL